MEKYKTNEERTLECLNNFSRENTLKIIMKKKSPVIFDIGANDGLSFKEFKNWWPKSIIHCFEPQKECWPLLQDRVNSFSKENKTFINKLAVSSNTQKKVSFFTHNIDSELSEFNSGLSGFNKINFESSDSINLDRIRKELSNDDYGVDSYFKDINHERLVDKIRLDDYMKNLGINHIDILKIDTQGHEPEVLSGLGGRLVDVDIVVTELMFYDYYERKLSFSDIENYLLPAGFQLYDISHISKNPMNGRTDWIDVIYINKNLIEPVNNSV